MTGGPGRAPGQRVKMTGAEAILRVLESAGVIDVFGLASGKLSPLFRALSNSSRFRFTGVRHEAAAGFMATSVFAASGRLALCLGETGPGGMNLMTGLGGAAANNLAVLAITSSNPSQMMSPDRGAFSSTDNQLVFGAIAKWSATVRDAARIPEILHRAVRVASSGRPGPVHLDIPAELLARQCEYALEEVDAMPVSYRSLAPPVPGAAELEKAAQLLLHARRPLIVAGGGAARAHGAEALQRLVNHLDCPAMTTHMGIGVIPGTHPNFIGQGGFVGGPAVVRALRECDLVLAVGCRFSSYMWTEGPPKWTDAPDRKLIQVDIDPHVIGQNVPLTLGLQGDARATLEGILDVVGQRPSGRDPAWGLSLSADRNSYVAQLLEGAERSGSRLHPATLAKATGAFIGPRDFVTLDGGHTSFWSNEFTPAFEPGTRFHEPGMSHLGFGLPAAIALARCYPERRSFCITGDGSFGFTLQELDTARRYQANVITIIHNNEAWGVIRAAQKAGGFELGTSLEDTDYAAIARAFGCYGERIDAAGQIEPALLRAVQSGLPAVLDARVSFVPHPMLGVFGASTAPR
jgi:thiamine pyrophosphate-dependent acetolactate synthase large subunit-like protein